MAFGNALVCQRCLHYRTKFGDPTPCETCHKLCAFIKDEMSREKVDGKILCWLCTYNFKLARNKEAAEKDSKKKSEQHKRHGVDFQHSRRHRRERNEAKDEENAPENYSSDSIYNDHLLKISSLQDEIHQLQSQLEGKKMELIKKDNIIAELKTDLLDMDRMFKDKIAKLEHTYSEKQDQLVDTIKQLQKEKTEMSRSMKKRKSNASIVKMVNPFDMMTPLQKPQLSSQSTSCLLDINKMAQKEVQEPSAKPREGDITPPNSDEESPVVHPNSGTPPPSKKPRFVLDSSDSEEEEPKQISAAEEQPV
ncbi:Protein fam76b [Cichlidogyrus casuarinus]|uniref:Protein fam76b n=1 Tax=Cichlidogyrus casuarinus TaxID=1844966 RepID=A0ABD2Q4I0_9PLAT